MIKCVPHEQHDYFSSFNQSDHCFLVSSLPLPSSLRKLPKAIHDGNGNDNITNEEFDWSSEEKKGVLRVRHALMNKFMPSSAKQQREITTLTV